MEEIEKLHHLFRLKHVDRTAVTVKNRQESTAEHTYSTLILAEYFLPKVQPLDGLKVRRMLLVHDIVEIEAGDTFLYDEASQHGKEEREQEAFRTLMNKIPAELATDFQELWNEFEANETAESQFCKAIDKLDPIIHSTHLKEDWDTISITEQTLRDKKEHYFRAFPAIHTFFNKWIEHARQQGYFKQQ